MLPRKRRLKKTSFFTKNPKLQIGKGLYLISRDNNLSYNRYAVVISRRAVPKAVRRNALRRSFYNDVNKWPENGQDFIVFISSPASAPSKVSLSEELSVFSKKLDKYKHKS
jgi:ribonuclease P protein component